MYQWFIDRWIETTIMLRNMYLNIKINKYLVELFEVEY